MSARILRLRLFLRTLPLCFLVPLSEASAVTTAFVNVNVVPMDVETVLADQTVVVDGDVITAMGPSGTVTIPPGADIINGSGRYLMPGLTDAHVHLISGTYAENDLYLLVANGVTTVREMWGSEARFDLKDQVAAGTLLGPTIYIASRGLFGPPGYWGPDYVETPAQAIALVDQYVARGYDFIKTYDDLALEVFDALVDRAATHGIRVVGHVSQYVGVEAALSAGIASIEHLTHYSEHVTVAHDIWNWEHPWDEAGATAIAEATRDAGTRNCPTLLLNLRARDRIYEYLIRPEMRFASPDLVAAYVDPLTQPLRSTSWPLTRENKLRFVRKLKDTDAGILLGTDIFNAYMLPGFSIHEELELFAEAGLTPYEALRAGTVDAAEFLEDGPADFGMVAVGKRADLLLLNANPLDDVGNVNLREGVMLRGQWFSEADLQVGLEAIAATYDHPAAPFTPAEQDSLALIAFYHSTRGHLWSDDSGWLSGPLDTWVGITVDADRRVTKIELPNNNLRGRLPHHLDVLDKVRDLNLASNELGGVIPSDIVGMTGMQSLRLEQNNIYGEIPSGLDAMQDLQVLYLYDNQLSGTIPGDLANLPILTQFALSSNQLTGEVPAWLGDMETLFEIYLHRNQLTGEIPPELGNLTNLTALSLSHNQLTGEIPPEIGDLSNLVTLYLNDNQLTGQIPPELGNLDQAVTFYINANELSGPIPPELGNLSSLNTLALLDNQLTGTIPPELGDLSNLTQLFLHTNQLTGPIPLEIFGLTKLIDLGLAENQLTGPIPPEIGNLTDLLILHLAENQFTGQVPPEVGNLTKLFRFLVYDNSLSGTLPDEITNLTLLEEFRIHRNAFDHVPELPLAATGDNGWIFGNRLTFEDIEPNVGKFTTYRYSPQADLGDSLTIDAVVGSDVQMDVVCGGSANVYAWLKDDVVIGGETSPTLLLTAVQPSDDGVYKAAVTNTIATELTIWRAPVTVNIVPESALIANLASAVEALELLGTIEHQLLQELGRASDEFDSGDTRHGISEMEDFLNRVESGVQAGDIPPGAGAALTDEANAFLDQVNSKLANAAAATGDIAETVEALLPAAKPAAAKKGGGGHPLENLLKPLQQAEAAYLTADSHLAAVKLKNFVKEVGKAVSKGTLGVADGEDLIEAAEAIVAWFEGGALLTKAVVAFVPEPEPLPKSFGLDQNHPNPFNPSTTIRYQLPEATPIRIEVYNLLGQRVRTLVDGSQVAGRHSVVWTGTDQMGRRVSSGVYIYRMTAGAFSETRRLLLLR